MHLSVPSLGARLAVSTLLVICLAVDHRANAQPADVRTITMRVAADESYRARTDWEAALRNTVQVVSDIYEKHFQVRFVILDIVPLTAGPDASLDHRRRPSSPDGGPAMRQGRPAGGARPFDRFV